jgi:hypothetical protein
MPTDKNVVTAPKKRDPHSKPPPKIKQGREKDYNDDDESVSESDDEGFSIIT